MTNAAFDPREVESDENGVVSEREGMRTILSSLASEGGCFLSASDHPYRWSEEASRLTF